METARTFRQQLLREAEGYLELVTVLADKWGLDAALRDRLARRALKQIRQAKRLGGPKFEAYYLEGEAFRTMHRFDAAVGPLRRAIRTGGDDPNVHVHLALAWCYKRTDRLDRAIETLEDALRLDPTEAILYYNLACYWSLSGNARLAIGYLSESFDLDPKYRELVAEEEDFAPIRKDPAFQSLVSVIV